MKPPLEPFFQQWEEKIIKKIFESQEMQLMKSKLESCTRDSSELVTVVQDHTMEIKSIKSEINQTIEMIEREEIKTETGKTRFIEFFFLL